MAAGPALAEIAPLDHARGGPAAAGAERSLGVGAGEVRSGMNRGVQGIVEEVAARLKGLGDEAAFE